MSQVYKEIRKQEHAGFKCDSCGAVASSKETVTLWSSLSRPMLPDGWSMLYPLDLCPTCSDEVRGFIKDGCDCA